MKPHLGIVQATFFQGCERALVLKSIFDHLQKVAPPALNCDDVLRSAVVLVTSSFDLLIHDIFREEAIYRLSMGIEISSLRIPFNSLLVKDQELVATLSESIKRDHSHKSFIAPDKLSECLSVIVPSPWDKIADVLGEPSKSAKLKLRQIVDLRNRIAHEADVNPNYSGIELWPIYPGDVDESILYIKKLGAAVLSVIDGH